MTTVAAAVLAGALSISGQPAANIYSATADFVRDCPVRDAGTPGAAKAARWLYRTINRAGCDAEIDTFQAPAPGGETTFRNIYVELKSPNPAAPWIILASHYDTKPGMPKGFQGANDGAASSMLLVELARQLRSAGRAPDCSIAFVWLDGEECRGAHYSGNDGLQGSVRAAQRFRDMHRRVVAAVNIDMIADKNLHIRIPRNGTKVLRQKVVEAAADIGMPSLVSLGDDIVLDDHESFLKAGFPAVDFIDFDYGSAPGRNDWWHTEHDTMENISAESIGKAGDLVLALLRRFGYRPVKSR